MLVSKKKSNKQYKKHTYGPNDSKMSFGCVKVLVEVVVVVVVVVVMVVAICHCCCGLCYVHIV